MVQVEKKRVLIVDDDVLVTFVSRQALQKLSDQIEVVVARSGREAMDKIREAAFDLVVTDLRMPEMNGVQLTQEISASCPGTVVVWMTAHGGPQVLSDAARLAVYRCVEKPLGIEEIRHIVSEALATSPETA